MNLSIRNRIAVTLSLVLTALAAVYALSLFTLARERLLSELDQKLEIETLVTADLIRLVPDEVAQKLRLRDLIEAEEAGSPSEFFDLDVWQGTTPVYRRPSANSIGLLAKHAFDPDAQFVASQQVNGRRVRIVQGAFQHQGATWFVRVAGDESSGLQGLAALRLVAWVSILVVLALTMLLSYWLAGRALRPLARFAAETNSISELDLTRRVAVPATGDEMAQLALAFNELLDRLQTAFTELRQFTADASHELRTPLTVMRSVGELALTAGLTAPQYRTTIGQMLEEVEQLTQLVESLLMLARGEAGHWSIAATPFVPREIVEAVCALMRPLAEKRNQLLSVRGDLTPPTLVVSGLIELGIMNIVHNAIKFTPDGGRIDVQVDCDESGITIVVEDTGPGISANERDKIFNRFYRSDQGQSADEHGFGLGLSIARAAIGKLDGTISAGQSPSGGASIRIEIPNKDRALP